MSKRRRTSRKQNENFAERFAGSVTILCQKRYAHLSSPFALEGPAQLQAHTRRPEAPRSIQRHPEAPRAAQRRTTGAQRRPEGHQRRPEAHQKRPEAPKDALEAPRGAPKPPRYVQKGAQRHQIRPIGPQRSGHSTPGHAQEGKKRPQATPKRPKRPQERSQRRKMKNRRCDDDAQSRELTDVLYGIIGFISDNMIL